MDGEQDRRGRRWKRKRERERERIKERSVGGDDGTSVAERREEKMEKKKSRPGDPQLYTRGSAYCTCVSRTREERVRRARRNWREREGR